MRQVPTGSQFDLNVVGVAQDDERTPAVSLDVLNARVCHAQGIKAVRPRFKSAEVAHTKGDMVESHPPLVKGRSIAPGMHHSCDNQTAGVRHSPRAETRVPPFCEKFEAHHLLPPAHGAITVGNGEIQMPEPDNRRIRHSGILPK
jgi:hypothetical protein